MFSLFILSGTILFFIVWALLIVNMIRQDKRAIAEAGL